MVLEYILLFLNLILLIGLFIGLLSPGIVFLGRNATRFKVSLIYGLGILLVIAAFMFVHSRKPPTETDFINAIEEARDTGGLENLKPDKRNNLCQSLTPARVTDWIGNINWDKSTTQSGLKSLHVSITRNIYLRAKTSYDEQGYRFAQEEKKAEEQIAKEKESPSYVKGFTEEDLMLVARRIAEDTDKKKATVEIPVGSPLYKKIIQLKQNQIVRFSGTFFKPNKDYCVGEDISKDNNFYGIIFVFSDISPVIYKFAP